MKIYFTGGQGSGKTAQLDFFIQNHPEFHVVKFHRRELFEQGVIRLNQEASPMDEAIILGDFMLALATTPSPFISERSFIDKCAYAQALKYPPELLDAYHIMNTYIFPGISQEDNYFYFPPVLPLEDDGVRSTDKEYLKEVDTYIRFYLDYFNIDYHNLESKSLLDRHIEICETLNIPWSKVEH